jgi:hypothetical protein
MVVSDALFGFGQNLDRVHRMHSYDACAAKRFEVITFVAMGLVVFRVNT